MTDSKIKVFSEIGKLKKVLLKRPGEEVENLTPALLPKLLFDDIPYLKIAKEEHDEFAKTLKNLGIEVVYLEDLVVESFINNTIKEKFAEEFIFEAGIRSESQREALKKFLLDMSPKDMVLKMMSGIYKYELPTYKTFSLGSLVNKSYPFMTDPMPNLIFTRDPFACIGNGVSLHRMKTDVRQRETLFGHLIFKYHPEYGNNTIPLYYKRHRDFSIEGGDILVLSDTILAVGISERTESRAIDKLARDIFTANTSFKTILAMQIPETRSFMHLDTVFTHIDKDKFTIHPEIKGPLVVYKMEKDETAQYGVKVSKQNSTLEDTLKDALGLSSVTLIECAGGHPVHAAREQWNDGTNTLAVAPGEVVVYNRNHMTNRILKESGIKVHEVPSSELSRGRGGPRCMSMPLIRDAIK
ncbi:MAG: arginine deiminase [Alphaproteobacteria bacterium]|jgi:arginine deiminase|nr:arginine deiminase [Alphaproteobacteria bacterium]